MVRLRSATGSTVVVALEALLTRAGSAVVADTLAWFVIDVPEEGVTMMLTVALAPFATAPRLQVTVPLDCEQVPCDGVAESYVTPLGSVSVTVTPVAPEGPAFWTSSVYVSWLPEDTGSGESDFEMARSAIGSTRVLSLAELFAELGSFTAEATIAWFVIDPGDGGVTLIWMLTLSPLATVPRAHVTVPDDSEQLPCDGRLEL